MPKVSVVIPTYNSGKYLPEAIDSVLNQTYQDFEIIVVDDGSIDMTKSVMETYLDAYKGKIRYLRQENKGPGAARNAGIEISRGEYIAFQDADDLWRYNKLEKQIEVLEKHPDISLVFSDMRQVNEKEVLYKAYLLEKGYYERYLSGNIAYELSKINFIFTPTVILRKNIFSQIGMFNESYRVGEDYDMWLRIAKKFKVRLVNEPLVVRRIHCSNTINNRQLYREEHVRFLANFEKNNIFNNAEKTIFRKRRMQEMYYLGGHYFYEGEYKRAAAWFAKSILSKNGLKALVYLIVVLGPTKFADILRDMKIRMKIYAKSKCSNTNL